VDKLGPKLVVHDEHGYSHWDKLVPSLKVVCGRTVVGIYFSADWCTPCVQFTPLLMNLHASHRAKNTAATTATPPFKVILISQCWDAAATEHYFSAMPWTAMPHADTIGLRGAALMEKFGVIMILALILLDGEGAVVCRHGQEQLLVDPTRCNFTWTTTSSRTPRVGLDLMAHTRPDVARLAKPLQPPTMEQLPKFQ
jgi:nucleoredoxin